MCNAFGKVVSNRIILTVLSANLLTETNKLKNKLNFRGNSIIIKINKNNKMRFTGAMRKAFDT